MDFSPSKYLLVGKLAVVQVGVKAFLFQQFPVGSLFHNVSLIHHHDAIRFLDGAQPVRYDKAGPTLHHFVERLLNPDLRTGIDAAGSLVQNEHRRIAQHDPCDTQKLLLALGDVSPIL